ncbi:unnamed protein product [Cylindrotheca closterium]|uniref:Uncharacterized protein n=2 Tax=Cylindrotheca closterium TaxID=2856 RepID=A0AAD2FKU6_9STRA|nr:unnamed protein product [Cylindrotheca closterium]
MASTHMLRQTIIVNEGDSPLAYKAREVTNPVMQYVSFFDNNFERKRKVEVWNGASGKNVEPLLRSIQSFRNISSEWGLNQGRQKKALFKQFLTAEPHMTYQRISDAHGNSVQDFEDSVDEFICEYTGENPKYQANMYLFDTSNHIRKPYNTEIGIHANRLKTLFMYHDMLPGNCSNVNDENDPGQIRKRKLALFRSFPIDWQGDFINSRNDPANDDNITWKDIAVEAFTTIVFVVVVVMVDQAMVINHIQGPRALQDILKGLHKVFNVEANPRNKTKDDINQDTPTMVAGAVDSMASAVDAPNLVVFSQDEPIKAEANHINKTVKISMLSRTTIKKLFAAECSVPEWNQDGMSYGGMPSAEQYQHQEQYYQAEENQQWNDQYNYEQEEYYPEEQEAHEHFSYDEDSPFSFHEEHY